MSVLLPLIPFNASGSSTAGSVGSIDGLSRVPARIAKLLFLLAVAATLTISQRDPVFAWSYEIVVFLLAVTVCGVTHPTLTLPGLCLVGIAAWGLVQLALGATVYRYATAHAALQCAAFWATALAASFAARQPRIREAFLGAMTWFGFLVSVTGVLAYFTSPDKILWLFPSPYPDNWGPFPSRNNFAQFLELCLPVGLYWMDRPGPNQAGSNQAGSNQAGSMWMRAALPAAMLAAGLASASRAGGILLVVETAVVAVLLSRGQLSRGQLSRGQRGNRTGLLLRFAALALVLMSVAGTATLWNRLGQPDPLEFRREIFRSAASMVRERPWTGYGLGTFSLVYPEFAVFDTGLLVDHAHNDWLEWAAEGGLPFAGVWAALAIWTAAPAARSIWGLGVPAIFLHAFVDYPFARFGVTAWTFVLVGFLAESFRSADHLGRGDQT